MSLQEIIYRGSTVSTAAAQTIQIPAGFDEFILRNTTRLNALVDAGAGTGIVESRWYTGLRDGYANTFTYNGGTGAIANAWITTGGFTYTDTSTATLGAAVAVTAITAATPAVASTATTPLVGQVVRVYGTTGMLQIAGMDFSVTAVNPGVAMTLGYLPAVGFAAAATAGNYRLVPFAATSYPRWRYITNITAAASAVVTFSVTHGYNVGQKLYFKIPTAFGMTQMNGLTGTITAINTATNTVTLDIDSSAFTAFAFPTSAIAANGVSFPIAVPAGENANTLLSAYTDTGTRQILIGSSICGTAADVMDYWAIRSAT